jgi:chorismate synthase
MNLLRYFTAGESHGKALVGIIEGMPAGLEIDEEYINFQLSRRRKGYGRGGRMKIESDQVQILSGVRGGFTLGTPVSFMIENRDYSNWEEIMASGREAHLDEKTVRRPRPGHADLPGAIKYGHTDIRNVLERASARETAARVAAGAFFRRLLETFNINLYSYVVAIGPIRSETIVVNHNNIDQVVNRSEQSAVRCLDQASEKQMLQQIDQAQTAGESLGGVFEVGAVGALPGLGSYSNWDRRLDADLGQLLMSIPAIKAAEIGEGIQNAARNGSQVHDEMHYNNESGLFRPSNHAGGIEGGVSNGETIWARAYMKPIPTLYKPLISVNTETWQEEKADIERSDICAVPAAAVVGEAMLAFGLARAFLDKFGGDNIEQIMSAYRSYNEYVKRVWKWQRI